ncbi:MAG: GNAT family N-acetyltransferase [Saprospiraceae bacterium]|nr:GNAT family N-acetyltransferase [Saprospiraceae bacterium]
MTIRLANPSDLPALARAFSAYRVFYGQPDQPEEAQAFLRERMERSESVVFIAVDNDRIAGFTQLYPSFTSVGMRPIWILNDLYVYEDYRKQGVAQALIEAVLEYSRQTGRKKVALATAYDNVQAQRLYERIGFVRDPFYNYEILTEHHAHT